MAVINSQFETKGTHLFFIDTVTTTDPTVTKVTCPTSIQGIGGGERGEIDTTCLDVLDEYGTSIPGRATAPTLTVPFVLYKGDVGHQALFAMKTAGTTTAWMLGLSDSATYPTLDSDMTALVTPAARTTFAFSGYITSVELAADENQVIRGTLLIKQTGGVTPYWAA